MEDLFKLVFVWVVLAMFYIGLEAVFGIYWVVGIIPGFFVGAVLLNGLE